MSEPVISDALLERASTISSATLHEAGGKIGALPHAIKPVVPSWKICGRAMTVHGPGGDNLWIHRAIYKAAPGDVLVVHVSNVHAFGYWGEIMSTAAQTQKLAGLVIDGCVRDADQLEKIGFPIFARGLCIRGTGKDLDGKGWINAPVLFDDVTVMPGDLIVGDRDGVVAIPAAHVSEVVDAGIKRDAHEAEMCNRLVRGETTLGILGIKA